jgi:release factor glutamine methyltransferase
LPLTLSAATLVPRPDTETVVELALEMLRAFPAQGRPLRIADLGTGSGAILLALLSELPRAVGIGTDISEKALQTAHSNAVDLGLADRATFIACDYASVCRALSICRLQPALHPLGRYRRARHRGGLTRLPRSTAADGLDAYRALIPQAMLLAPRAPRVEVGQGQHGDVRDLMTTAGLAPEGSAKAIWRASAGRRRPQSRHKAFG